MPLLEVKNINTGYGKKQVLHDVSFAVEQGEIVLLIGSNGSGKSTVLKAICGLLHLWNIVDGEALGEKGHIYFDGEEITGLPPSRLLKKGLLYIPQKDNLFPDLTVKENLEMAGLTIKNRGVLKERIDSALDTFSTLVPHLNRTPMKLSGGERQTLTIAMASLHKPKMIMFDEPFAGLSERSIIGIKEKLETLNKKEGVCFLIVEHRVKELLSICNSITALKLGCILFTNKLNFHTDGIFEEVFT